MTFRKTASISLSIFSFFFLYSLFFYGGILEANAKTDTKNPAVNASTPQKKWAVIDGFRSAKFGMDEKKVKRAIAKDFKISKSKIDRKVHPIQKTLTLNVNIPDLFATGGTACITYILGHKSKKLMHINVLWGRGAAEKVDGKDVFTTANLLRTHFLKKRYKEEGLVANGKLSDTSTMVFRGKDKKNRMILLMLGTQLKEEGMTDEQIINSTSLVLSYLLNPDEPDVRKIVIQEDEF